MKKDFWKDYLGYTAFKLIGPLIRLLPLGLSMSLGRFMGELIYCLDYKHRCLAYSNIKMALGDKFSPCELKKITKQFYLSFGQNIIDIFLIPVISKEHMNKYLEIEGKENIAEAFKKGKGVIFSAVHAGSWELSNVICAGLGFPFRVFVRGQNFPRLNKLLNAYRRQKGCRIFEREDQNQLRRLIEALKANEAIGMTADQGGKTGILVDFFGKSASMPSGAVKLALRYDAAILPSFYTRTKDAYYKLIIAPPFSLKRTGNSEEDIRINLQALVKIFEGYITKYPNEYLWTYKIWKYSDIRDILILSDGKTGHLRQAEAAADAVSAVLREKGIKSRVKTLEIKFRNRFSRRLLAFCALLAGKYSCQGCSMCLRRFLSEDSYQSLIKSAADIIISCGSSVAAVNYVVSRENRAKSIVIMRPSLLGLRRFDLAVIPRHDHPPQRKNIVVTEGSLNLIDGAYLKEQAEKLMQARASSLEPSGFNIGVLIGGDSKGFYLDAGLVKVIIGQLKDLAEKQNANIFITTSRRTRPEVEQLVKDEFKDYPKCRFLVIAGEDNPSYAVGGILSVSRVVVISPESISMISEAVSSGKYVVVFDAPVSRRHRAFLNRLVQKRYIHLAQPREIAALINKINLEQPEINVLRDKEAFKQAIARII
jgi:Kdo2-lipid IVA lauroyltransferase/acyltransferase